MSENDTGLYNRDDKKAEKNKAGGSLKKDRSVHRKIQKWKQLNNQYYMYIITELGSK